jgi:chemotaxis protein CheX
MNQTVEIANVCEFMKNHLADVFDTMLATKAVLSEGESPDYPHRVSGSVGFAGDTVTGAVYLHLSAAFANRATAAMLGLPPEEISREADVNDVVGEVTNMLTGGLKSWLCDVGAPCSVSTPAIIRGTSFAVEPMPNVERARLLFNCGTERVVVEIHIKLN